MLGVSLLVFILAFQRDWLLVQRQLHPAGAQLLAVSHASEVCLRWRLPADQMPALSARLREVCAGRVQLTLD